MKVYAFLHNACVFESAAYTKSLHATKVGAYKAMRRWLIVESMKHRDTQIEFGGWKDLHFGSHEWWGIKSMEVFDSQEVG